MTRTAWIAVLGIGLVLVPSWKAQEEWRNACLQKCVSQRGPGDPELQTQEIASLEKEAARAIQSNSGTFFYRVYSDEFAGTLSHGQQVNKTQWIEVIESRAVKYESFHATDIKVRVFQETAVATCLWSSRSIVKGERISSQLRVVHVYVNTPSGWHVVSAQATNLPPDVHQPL